MKNAFVVGFLSLMLIGGGLPFTVNAQTTAATCNLANNASFDGVVKCVVSIFNVLIALMIAASVVYIVYGAFTMISNEEKREDAKKTIYYGIIGLFVMISIWGFVNILVNTFGLKTITDTNVRGSSPTFITIPS